MNTHATKQELLEDVFYAVCAQHKETEEATSKLPKSMVGGKRNSTKIPETNEILGKG
jgi:hypothetical protein